MRPNPLVLANVLVALSLSHASAAVVCAGSQTVLGIDVSHYQGSIDWNQVKGSGRAFGIASVGDGTYQDPDFAANWDGMKAAGLIRGAYQFFEPGDDPITQANILIGKVGTLGPGDLPAMLDVEVSGGQSGATITANIHAWIDAVTTGTGKVPIIYTGKYFWNGSVGSGDFSQNPLVIAAYDVSCPDTPSAWSGWQIWQYSDSDSVAGIAGGVDGDMFNGSLADLQAFASGGFDWQASYVSQSFPLASTAVHLTTHQKLAATIQLMNGGKQSWDANTRLGTTQPRDRMSPFASSDWLGPNRPAAVSGTVAPGSSYTFSFTFQAPMQPGTYHEYFSLVEEGVAWFSDPGQGGPPDDQLEATFIVDPADWAAEVSTLSFGADPVGVAAGGAITGFVELKNVGKQTWTAGLVKLAPTPRDKPSPLAGDDWLSQTRVSTLTADVPPGQVGHFPLTLHGNTNGTFTQTFGLVADGITWFGDAPAGGGPSDADIVIKVQVGIPASLGGGAGETGGSSGMGGMGGDTMASGSGGAGATGCSLAPRATLSPAMLLAALALLAIAQRRRMRS
jgi:lysozyme